MTEKERKAYKKYEKACKAAQKDHKTKEEGPRRVKIDPDIYYAGHGMWASYSPLKRGPQCPPAQRKSQRDS